MADGIENWKNEDYFYRRGEDPFRFGKDDDTLEGENGSENSAKKKREKGTPLLSETNNSL